jgi:hypothetical protein
MQYVVPPEQGHGAVSSPRRAALIFVSNPIQNRCESRARVGFSTVKPLLTMNLGDLEL